MTALSVSTEEALLAVHIGQNVNPAGILQSEIFCPKDVQALVYDGLVRENQWYRFHQFITTKKGSAVAEKAIRKKIEETENKIRAELKGILFTKDW